MLTELCKYLNNYFVHDRAAFHFGTFSIVDGSIGDLEFLQDGQYFRICGSVFNDGVYKYPAEGLKDETFDGAIWAMSVPPEVEALAAEIDAWVEANADVLNSPFQSESFGGYSYNKSSGGSGGSSGTTFGWESQFASRLSLYRRAAVFK